MNFVFSVVMFFLFDKLYLFLVVYVYSAYPRIISALQCFFNLYTKLLFNIYVI